MKKCWKCNAHTKHVLLKYAIIYIYQIVAIGMKRNGKGGSIVNISSQASMVAIDKHTVYCASKGALDQLTKVMALELGPHQVTVTS